MHLSAERVLGSLRAYLPVRMVRWLDRQLSKRALARMKIPPEWLREGPDGFKAKDEIDIVFGSRTRIRFRSAAVLRPSWLNWRIASAL